MEVLAEIKRLASLDRIVLTDHARFERMPERSATYDDVRQALLTATAATWQNERENGRVEGGSTPMATR